MSKHCWLNMLFSPSPTQQLPSLCRRLVISIITAPPSCRDTEWEEGQHQLKTRQKKKKNRGPLPENAECVQEHFEK